MKNDLNQTIDNNVYQWFVTQRSKKSPISGPVLQQYTRNVVAELGNTSGFKTSNGWFDRFKICCNMRLH